MKNKIKIGIAIRSLRVLLNMTGDELARKSKIKGYSDVTRIENGKHNPSTETFGNICSALGVPRYLVYFLASTDAELEGLPEEVRNGLSRQLFDLVRNNASKASKQLRNSHGWKKGRKQ